VIAAASVFSGLAFPYILEEFPAPEEQIYGAHRSHAERDYDEDEDQKSERHSAVVPDFSSDDEPGA
jgi:hypothetical protein